MKSLRGGNQMISQLSEGLVYLEIIPQVFGRYNPENRVLRKSTSLSPQLSMLTLALPPLSYFTTSISPLIGSFAGVCYDKERVCNSRHMSVPISSQFRRYLCRNKPPLEGA